MDIKQEVEEIEEDLDLLPSKSKDRYMNAENDFRSFMMERNVEVVDEGIVLMYLIKKSTELAPSGLYPLFSMLKSTITEQRLDNYYKVKEFLKTMTKGYTPKKSPTFSLEQCNEFINNSDPEIYLLDKVVAILGICGGMRRKEVHELSCEDVIDHGHYFEVNVRVTKNKVDRSFDILNKEGQPFLDIMKAYISKRPKKWDNNKFFFAYGRGKSSTLPVGINKIGTVPVRIAKYLKLDDPKSYTGHAFRSSKKSRVKVDD